MNSDIKTRLISTLYDSNMYKGIKSKGLYSKYITFNDISPLYTNEIISITTILKLLYKDGIIVLPKQLLLDIEQCQLTNLEPYISPNLVILLNIYHEDSDLTSKQLKFNI